MWLVFEFDGEGVRFLGLYNNIPSRDIDDPPLSVTQYNGRNDAEALKVAAINRINLDKLTLADG